MDTFCFLVFFLQLKRRTNGYFCTLAFFLQLKRRTNGHFCTWYSFYKWNGVLWYSFYNWNGILWYSFYNWNGESMDMKQFMVSKCKSAGSLRTELSELYFVFWNGPFQLYIQSKFPRALGGMKLIFNVYSSWTRTRTRNSRALPPWKLKFRIDIKKIYINTTWWPAISNNPTYLTFLQLSRIKQILELRIF